MVEKPHLSYGSEFSRATQEAERSKFVVMKVEQERRAAIIHAEGESETTKLISDGVYSFNSGKVDPISGFQIEIKDSN